MPRLLAICIVMLAFSTDLAMAELKLPERVPQCVEHGNGEPWVENAEYVRGFIADIAIELDKELENDTFAVLVSDQDTPNTVTLTFRPYGSEFGAVRVDDYDITGEPQIIVDIGGYGEPDMWIGSAIALNRPQHSYWHCINLRWARGEVMAGRYRNVLPAR